MRTRSIGIPFVRGFARLGASLLIGVVLGCTPTVDYENVEGIGHAEDGLFHYVDYPDTTADEAFGVVERLFRTHFAGARIAIDRERRTIETEPRPFADRPLRLTMFGEVTAQATTARVELFAKVDRLVDDALKSPTNPWKYISADAGVENRIFEELWDELVVAKRVKAGASSPPVPASSILDPLPAKPE